MPPYSLAYTGLGLVSGFPAWTESTLSPEGGSSQPRVWTQKEVTHRGSLTDAAQVVEESFGMVDCGLQMSAGRQPLSVQVLPSQ